MGVRNWTRAALAGVLAGSFALSAAGQTDWPAYGHDPGGARFSPLTQINTTNVAKLQPAWTIDTGEIAQFFETTPIVVGKVLYFTTPNEIVIAASATSGKMLWRFDPHVDRAFHQRGVTYWPGDADHAPRILFATTDGRMFALDAATGKQIDSFGKKGVVELKLGLATDHDPNPRLGITSPPVIYKNLVILGPETQEGPSEGPSGDPRAFDVVSGSEVWRFHTVPRPGEPGNKSWGPNGWVNRAGPSAWGLFTVDTKRGIVFIPTGNPADNMYGGDRKGTDLYSDSVVALKADTGKLLWSYQLVHHDIWDYDVAANPAVIEVEHDGKKVPAIAEIGKNGLLFILDELTGKPLNGVVEKQVPRSDVPGEESWPTQPFPATPPLSVMSINAQQLNKLTPESEEYCKNLFAKMHNNGPYTPYGTQLTAVFPGSIGGGNWNGVAFDPGLGYIVTNVSNIGAFGQMVASPDGPEAYRNADAYARFRDDRNYPCNQPPWGELVAVNASTGKIAWKSVLGEYPELAAKGIKNTGAPNLGGSIATAGGLIFVGATVDHGFRAFDTRTGKLLWAATLNGYANATPITYMGDDGKQYVVVADGGPGFLGTFLEHGRPYDGKLVAYALPPIPAASAGVIKLPVSEEARRPATYMEPGSRRPSAAAASSPTAEMGSAQPGAAPAAPQANGQPAAFASSCLKCHGMGTITAQRRSGQDWTEKINEMASMGATGSAQDLAEIAKFLTDQYGLPVDINTASADAIENGLLLSAQNSASIVAYRQQHGTFHSLKDVEAVPGVDVTRIEAEKANITF